jgi:imidazole glycerol phosphate synthase subunit HisF
MSAMSVVGHRLSLLCHVCSVSGVPVITTTGVGSLCTAAAAAAAAAATSRHLCGLTFD